MRPPSFQKLSPKHQAFIFHCEYLNTFFGCCALIMLLYAWLSKYWVMINPRLNAPETRVISPSFLLETREAIDFSFFQSYSETKLDHFPLSDHFNQMCNEGDELPEGDCIDCRDMQILGDVKVMCRDEADTWDSGTSSFAIPSRPAYRVGHCHVPTGPPTKMDICEQSTKTPCSMVLRYGCDKPEPVDNQRVCPIGYQECPKNQKVEDVCPPDEGHNVGWRDFTCCLNKTQVGWPLYDVKEAPTYVHVFGFMKWRQERDGPAKSSDYCLWRQYRCELLRDFAVNGIHVNALLCIEACALVLAVGLGFSRYRHKFISFIALLYLAAGGTGSLAMYTFQAQTERTLKRSMSQVDGWGRPFVHPVYEYNNKYVTDSKSEEDSILNPHFDEPGIGSNGRPWSPANPEWAYYKFNAQVDYTTRDEEYPSGYRRLWGWNLGCAQCAICFVSFIGCLELFFAYQNASPILGVLQLLAFVACCVPCVCRTFIDNYLAPYPVLWIYPWQKLYPKCFTVGSWLPEPFDTLYDCVLMLPVHIIRALWDYVSCQDICSPQEKELLAKRGIVNDRLQSLLCSRRSYFVMMASMGIFSFVVKLETVIELSKTDIQLRQAVAEETSYEFYRCNRLQGDCAMGVVPDLASLASYTVHMVYRVLAIIEEGYNQVQVMSGLIEWVSNFIGIFCACAALANWTDFRISRRFCIAGWLIICITPVCTCAFRANDYIDHFKVHEAMELVMIETWMEVDNFVRKAPCDDYAEWTSQAVSIAEGPCDIVLTVSWIMYDSWKDKCKIYLDMVKDHRKNEDKEQVRAKCMQVVEFLREVKPATKQDVEDILEEYMPSVMDVVRTGIGARAGINNIFRILPAVTAMVPGLMQGGLMFKNVVPRQTLPAILTTLPWAFTSVFWAQYQGLYQVLPHPLLWLAAIAMSFCPLVYYVYGKIYNLEQPMDDQQSITVTFRLWYYSLIFAMVLPYGMIFVFICCLNDYHAQMVWDYTVGSAVAGLPSLLSGTLMMYAYTLQAGIDWFVAEIVETHVCHHTPAVLAFTNSKEEADELQERLGTSIDTESIVEGTYVCGGLSDPNMMEPPKEGDWQYKARVYVCSLAEKDSATLDAFSAHVNNDHSLGDLLRRARREYWALMDDPPPGVYVWDERAAAVAEQVQERCRQGGQPPKPPGATGAPGPAAVEMEMTSMSGRPAAGQPMQQQMVQPPRQQMRQAGLQNMQQSVMQNMRPYQQPFQQPFQQSGQFVGPQQGQFQQMGQPLAAPGSQQWATGDQQRPPGGGPLGRIGGW